MSSTTIADAAAFRGGRPINYAHGAHPGRNVIAAASDWATELGVTS